MSVLHVIAPAPVGGAETVVLSLASAMTTAQIPTAIAAIVDEPSHPFLAAATARGLRFRAILAGHRRYAAQSRAIAEYAREVGATVVHTHGFHADVIGYWGGRRARLPVVTTLHGFTGATLRDAIYDIAVRFTHRNCESVVAVSQAIATRLRTRGVRHDRIHHIPNAFSETGDTLTRHEARRLLALPEHGRCVGWVGRLSHEKGPDVLLAAADLLRTPDTTVCFVGDGPMREALGFSTVGAATTRGASTRQWLGVIPDARRVLPAFDVLVLSSRTEGTPMVLLEAMSQGVPIVCTTVGGVPEMLGDADAIRVPPENPTRLADAIDRALGDEAGSRDRAASALRRVRSEYETAQWVERHRRLYDFATTPR